MMDDFKYELGRLETDRLRLIALTQVGLRSYVSDIETLEAGLGQRLSRGILTPIVRGAIQMKLEKMGGASSEEYAWYTYWLATVRETLFGAGLIGFKGPPDDQGAIEIGYGIDPEVSNRGYITEAAAALIEWAFQAPACERIVAPETRKDNPASHRVLAKLGMQAYAETEEVISYQVTRANFAQR